MLGLHLKFFFPSFVRSNAKVERVHYVLYIHIIKPAIGTQNFDLRNKFFP